MKKILFTICILSLFLISCAPETDLESKAKEFLNQENTDAVYVCGDYIKVVSKLVGGGSKFYKNNKEIHCPVVGPDSMTDECKELLFNIECKEIK